VQRPVNLDLTTISLPVTAITSISHRISGIILFLAIPGLLYLLQLSLQSEQGFSHAVALLNYPILKLMTFGFLAALIYHLLAGLRHLIMDFGYGESIATAKKTATLLLITATISIILMGAWLW